MKRYVSMGMDHIGTIRLLAISCSDANACNPASWPRMRSCFAVKSTSALSQREIEIPREKES